MNHAAPALDKKEIGATPAGEQRRLLLPVPFHQSVKRATRRKDAQGSSEFGNCLEQRLKDDRFLFIAEIGQGIAGYGSVDGRSISRRYNG